MPTQIVLEAHTSAPGSPTYNEGLAQRRADAVKTYLNTHGFTRADAPILTANAAEGTTNLFETDYFGQPAFLSQSGQLYNEAVIASLGRVYCFGPTFLLNSTWRDV